MIEQEITKADREAAVKADKQFRQLWNGTRSSMDEMGKLFHQITENGYWKLLTYTDNVFTMENGKDVLLHARGDAFETIDSWLFDVIPEYGRSTLYAARARYKALREIPDEERKKIPIGNAEVLKEMPEKERAQPQWVKAAQTLTEAKLVEKIQAERPDLHIERKKSVKLRPAKSQHEMMDDAIAVSRWANGSSTREEALEAIFAHFLDATCEVEGFEHLTNRDAYNKANGIPKKKGAGA